VIRHFPFSILGSSPPPWRSRALLRAVTIVSLVSIPIAIPTATLLAQEAAKHTFPLAGGAHVTLTGSWSRRPDTDPPPVRLFLSSAPQFGFSDFTVLENRGRSAVFEFGASGNPFFGKDSVQLDTHIHESFLPSLFYLFFPPPRGCLAAAQSAFEAQLSAQEAGANNDNSNSASRALLPPVQLNHECSFSVTPLEFYSAQLTGPITLRGTRAEQRVAPTLRTFYLAPMEQVEVSGKTYFVFESRADHALQLREVQHFGLPDDRQGMRAHFFWAIGATTPFPFFRDPQRKDLQIFHVVYAALSLDGEARDDFRAILHTIQFGQ
jgi:hypothetical protein